MYVRLAFAVAAHLEPEILIVDEVLAVGDAEFQKKCLGKMDEVSRQEGRTVLFVSHNMAAVENLCTSAILLQNGSVSLSGTAQTVAAEYLRRAPVRTDRLRLSRPAWAKNWITDVRLLDDHGCERSSFGLGESITVEVRFSGDGTLRRPVLGIVVNHQTKGAVGGVNSRMTGYQPARSEHSAGIFRCRVKRPPLLQGEYSLDVWLGDGPVDVDMVAEVLQFSVEERDVYNSGVLPFKHMGLIFLEPTWSFEAGEEALQVRA